MSGAVSAMILYRIRFPVVSVGERNKGALPAVPGIGGIVRIDVLILASVFGRFSASLKVQKML
jgi:hypothetical protein